MQDNFKALHDKAVVIVRHLGKMLIQLLNDELFLELTRNNWKQVNDDETITQHSIMLDKTNLNGNFIFSLP